ncbi:DUF2147 domain-containing protein [Bradyrhizobium sp. WSM471]|uniref:DUF2147 domain-containing protein n=1 Tax=Bradyrhizobium sp. WSM471 TaxID=319017 RepID=UPI00024D27C2|nr:MULTISPECIES: DUF2147 domain-containing protein [Bradyrhizobium]EHR03431.1 hypothetical protein Bra471DRAFT_04210 [Bradyrhizobium sp. WSM471]UFW38643.1 DUF2147 domain-containing protein [Bradyrhizobium canariense]
MRKLLATAAFLLASTAAQAQYTFDYGGRTIRIDPDRGTVQIPGVYDNTGQGKAKKAKNDAKGAPKADPQAPQQAKADPQSPANPAPAPAPVTAPPAAEQAAVQAPVQAPVAVAPPAPPAPPATTANNAPAEDALVPPPQPAPSAAPTVAAVPPAPPPAPAVAAAPPAPSPPPVPAPAPAPVQSAAVAPPAPATAPTRDLNSPLGVWLTEEKEGKVRIEQCGSNLCGYSVDSKSNQNGEQVLINMKPGKDQNKDQKWSGRILDPNSGSTYDSTIALKGTDRLRVQGCAFGGMFCGGQIWTRVN